MLEVPADGLQGSQPPATSETGREAGKEGIMTLVLRTPGRILVISIWWVAAPAWQSGPSAIRLLVTIRLFQFRPVQPQKPAICLRCPLVPGTLPVSDESFVADPQVLITGSTP